jgi:hypothetical protein
MPTQSTILHARSRYHEWQGVGLLSLKTFYGGEAHYEVADGRYRVDDHCYLLLNAGQEYAITVDAPTAVESFCLFFAHLQSALSTAAPSISVAPTATTSSAFPYNLYTIRHRNCVGGWLYQSWHI